MSSGEHGGRGPLAGLRVVEFAGIGPGPHCGMLFSDLGADVLRIDRPGGNGWANPVVDRGRAVVTVDIRSDEGRAYSLAALANADVLIEGFRPGVMERLSLGPEDCLSINGRLIYARMTGWGQYGPLAKSAGHDINYIALTGALAAMGRAGEPASVPLNLVGDFGGGSMFLAFGIMAALWEREKSGKGQVIDAAIVDGVCSLMSMFAGLAPTGGISLDRDRNLLGGAAPYYRTYLCKDGKEISVGSLEPQFFSEMVTKLGLSRFESTRLDPANWNALTVELEAVFRSQDRAHWVELFADSDACVFPVMSLDEAGEHPHIAARQSYVSHKGLLHSAPAPRFSRTPGSIQDDRDPAEMLARWAAGTAG